MTVTTNSGSALKWKRVMGEKYAGTPLAKYFISNPDNVPEKDTPSEGDSHDVCTASPSH